MLIEVEPSRDDEGRRRYSKRGQLWDAFFEESLLVAHSTQPFLDGARGLLKKGFKPDEPLVMRHRGKDYDALRSTIGAAAKLAVTDTKSGPVFRAWHPHPRSLNENPDE